MRRKRPAWVRGLAREFIYRMLAMAEEVVKEEPELARRYVDLALRASSKYNVRIPEGYKKRICKHCHTLMVPGLNARVRVSRSDGAVIWICGVCGHVRRFGYTKEKGKRVKTPGEDRKERPNKGGSTRNRKASRDKGASKGKGAKK